MALTATTGKLGRATSCEKHSIQKLHLHSLFAVSVIHANLSGVYAKIIMVLERE